jgi:gamma-glutamylcyclotransferase (GGCT)/AIG2-like uncharacterized protein YtfP
MTDRILYFAYGSNMAIARLRSRAPSAELIGVAVLAGHQLKFHKRGMRDHSGKCDIPHTGRSEDRVFGVLYSIHSDELDVLDKVEGRGFGYERKTVTLRSETGETCEAETYIATQTDPHLRPLDWYKEHVLRGARAAGLPADYITSIDAVVADVDPNAERRARELAIYG